MTKNAVTSQKNLDLAKDKFNQEESSSSNKKIPQSEESFEPTPKLQAVHTITDNIGSAEGLIHAKFRNYTNNLQPLFAYEKHILLIKNLE